ncbi:MAG TPA: DUF6252 family protein [Flavobacterium sp.]
MKKIKILTSILMFAAAFMATSCGDTEPIGELVPDSCATPVGFQISPLVGSSVNLTWTDNGGASEWEVEYGPAGFSPGSGTSITSETTTLTIPDLPAAADYEFYVRALCSESQASDWAGPISFSACAMPTAVTATRVETNLTQVVVSWTPSESASQWQIEYGFVGFTPGSGTSVISNTPSKTLTGLSQNQDYHIWVRSLCGDEGTSFWAGPITVEAINALSANVNAVPFVSTEVTAATTTFEDVEYIEVMALNEEGESISVLVDKDLGVGTYNAPPDVICTFTDVEGEVFTANAVTPSTVTITQRTPHAMVGTFSFTVLDEEGVTIYTVTNGSFAVTF